MKEDYSHEYKAMLDKQDGGACGAIMGQGAASRTTGRNVLLDEAKRLRRRADQLDALALSIPENFPRDANEALLDLALASRR